MPLREEALKTLTSAGLTFLQAKVYFSLVTAGKADVKTISHAAGIDRSNVYKTIESLQEIGLIEKMVGLPNSYIALPIEYGLKMLQKQKSKECAASQKMSKEFLHKFAIQYKKLPEEEYFMILPGKDAFIEKWEKTLKNVQKSVDLIATEKREPKDEPIWEIYKDLLKKGVKVRWILDRSKHNDKEFLLRVKQFEHLFSYSNLQMKFSFTPQKPYGIACDNKFAVFFLDQTPCVKHSRTLWTNNDRMITAFLSHFEKMWTQAQEYKPNKVKQDSTKDMLIESPPEK
jgi:sugar-specific transcriptional regulator TrmB